MRKQKIGACIAVVLIAVIVFGILLRPYILPLFIEDAGQNTVFSENSIKKLAVAVPEYPEMAPYPDEESINFSREYNAWQEDVKLYRDKVGSIENLMGFVNESTDKILAESNGQNKVYSPISLYIALAMLAEVTDGNSRQQILESLNISDIEELRKQASDIWCGAYRNDGAGTSILASSLWLDESIDFSPEIVELLCKNYYASVFEGELSSKEMNLALQKWLNNETGGLLEDQVQTVEMSSETVMTLATTLFFQGKWDNEYNPEKTKSDVFYSSSGEVTCEYMCQSKGQEYYWGDKFSAISQGLCNGDMWFILPDENIAVDELLQDEQITEFILSGNKWNNSSVLTVNQAIPKFDVVSQMDVTEDLKQLGVTDVFDNSNADFSTLSDVDNGIFLSKVKQDVRVAVDEEGCTAAAYTAMMMNGASQPPENEIYFILNRPFIFAITGENGLPLFIGIINQPV